MSDFKPYCARCNRQMKPNEIKIGGLLNVPVWDCTRCGVQCDSVIMKTVLREGPRKNNTYEEAAKDALKEPS